MDFYDEIKDYTLEELELIIKTQKECYTSEEWKIIISLFKEKCGISEEDAIVICQKCDGLNSFDNDICEFCGNKLNKKCISEHDRDKKARLEYFYNVVKGEQSHNKQQDSKSYVLHYIMSFLIPLAGIIVGLILLTSNGKKERSVGGTCVVISIVSFLLLNLPIFILILVGLLI